VGVGQGGEPAYAEGAEPVDPFRDAAAVADRPRPPDLRTGLVELAPDRGLDPGRQEVNVDVEETREPEIAPERRDLGLVPGVGQDSVPPCDPTIQSWSAWMSTRWYPLMPRQTSLLP
jgi:hypothetical protein